MVSPRSASRLGLWDPLPNTAPSPHSSGGPIPALVKAYQGWLHLPHTVTFVLCPTPIPELPGLGFCFFGSQAVQLVLWAGEGVEDVAESPWEGAVS